MNFSPKKLRISNRVALRCNTVDGEMGIYSAHFVFESLGDTTDHVGNVGAHSPDSSNLFFFPNHLLTCNSSFLIICMSKAKCLKLRISLPRGPTHVTVLAFTLRVTPSGTLTVPC